MPYITQAQLPQLLRRFENVRFSGDALGQREYVDIAAAWSADSEEARCKYPDCDIRALTGSGIERQWDGKGEVIEWDRIRSITIGRHERGADGMLHYHPRALYHVIPAQQVAA